MSAYPFQFYFFRNQKFNKIICCREMYGHEIAILSFTKKYMITFVGKAFQK